MLSFALLAAMAPPVCFAVAAVIAGRDPGARPRLALRAASVGTGAALVLAVAAAGLFAVAGPLSGPTPFGDRIGALVRLDLLSTVMLLLVTFLGAVIVRFSRNYLDGDPRQGAFVSGLCLTLAAVCALVIAGSLAVLVPAWIATSLALHRLLTFYPARRQAIAAARKKFMTARIGDVCLAAAAGLLIAAFGTADIAAILDAARTAGAPGSGATVTLAGYLIVLAAVLKSAQFPTHGWLLEVMETPTPVSALLHAGIINAGGFLVLRFADVMVLAAGALPVLALLGAATALIGTAVLTTQSSVKVSLGWSTVAQMGFMLLQCGLGAFPLALLHIVAHSLYKAHAFLSSGSAVDLARSRGRQMPQPAVRPAVFVPSLLLALGLTYAGAAAAGLTTGIGSGELALAAILVMAVATFLIRPAGMAMAGKATAGRVFAGMLLIAAAGLTLYLGLHTAMMALTDSAFPASAIPGPGDWALAAAVVLSFGAVTVLQICGLPTGDTPSLRRLRIHLANGFYANAWFDRLVGSYRLPGAAR
ncbi:NADH-quinone oxidoreductase subunit L [Thalassobaculum sp. OXR-137]|uniref:NADH-quinone oxidoreductase subunit L n=1 Tax=Thalassobaculum sp. OXR-137 TaxID=3100173 RepID=UPI002AC975E9|nr:NADH-quinone oxidoreductase subunit L [Thalassobaculum sp. OXR-137]WPZ32372.1 NADH-quinone oxidoreductase subunit L [Thalassobaculum sp. OXR-137]